MINFEWYRTFKTIYECNSISEAAKLLHMTQPGVSKHLAALESRIGKKLFIRTARKILPTEFGKFLYTQIYSSVSGLEKAEATFNKKGNEHCPSIVIGCQYEFFKSKLLDLISSLDMYITVKFGINENLKNALEIGQIHLLIGTYRYNTYPHIFSPLTTEKLVLIASNDLEVPEVIQNNQAGPKALESWLKEQNWFAFDNELPFIRMFWEHHFKKRPPIKAKIVFSCFDGIMQIMQKTKGVCILPYHSFANELKDQKVKLISPSLETTNNKLFCAHKSTSENLYEIRLFKERMGLEL
ncbi:LysR family transcriptional regulator [Aquimarina hainanensis]|uniref:LysR family transcriptional regulator n=1 Tax=Aquimarina hainanensis TaxID=1578017 RepID=A0ABW5N8G5_9FLAO|nr:LysR family transcriptional regulator [Aquimarina sp. TRL1]QKX03666.1 LysR family transcriptional regulator [Aquimarina sp. TRL1]